MKVVSSTLTIYNIKLSSVSTLRPRDWSLTWQQKNQSSDQLDYSTNHNFRNKFICTASSFSNPVTTKQNCSLWPRNSQALTAELHTMRFGTSSASFKSWIWRTKHSRTSKKVPDDGLGEAFHSRRWEPLNDLRIVVLGGGKTTSPRSTHHKTIRILHSLCFPSSWMQQTKHKQPLFRNWMVYAFGKSKNMPPESSEPQELVTKV